MLSPEHASSSRPSPGASWRSWTETLDRGQQLSFICSTQAVTHQSIEVIGTPKRLEIVIPFNPPADTPTALLVDDGTTLDASLTRREIIPACDHYTEQAEAFALAVLRGEKPPVCVEDAIQNMRILDAIFESESRGGWADVTR
ncbi:hypothetical protein GCM10007989_38760 [Devosia pacifica]|uniref:Gfo/Idh/MocA-like oxidoreductase C-terminal domain-containing protein n=1 Tax=Devosia pacifica TaxID=1335967 RepID=A0A918W071_9HYPH|nr:hypothetical protein GCM10007989_38760 [Devosia pacifica]